MDEAQAFVLRHLLRLHGLAGLASAAIDEGTLRVPERAADAIRREWREAQTVSAALDGECERFGGAALARAGSLLPPILLKGPAVAGRYRDRSVRTYVDIDLLVPVSQLRSWSEVLRCLGYRAPSPEIEATRRRYQEGVAFTRTAGGLTLSCDLHCCLFIERRARDFTYGALARRCEPSAFPGLVQPDLPCQLVVLALHLAHHPAGVHRLIWLRDFVELAQPEAVASARLLAADHDIEWALESALVATQDLLGHAAWEATAPARHRWGLARVHQVEYTGYLRHLALVRELGPRAGAWYFASRVDPRRFVVPGGGVDWQASRAWARRVLRRTVATAFGRASRR